MRWISVCDTFVCFSLMRCCLLLGSGCAKSVFDQCPNKSKMSAIVINAPMMHTAMPGQVNRRRYKSKPKKNNRMGANHSNWLSKYNRKAKTIFSLLPKGKKPPNRKKGQSNMGRRLMPASASNHFGKSLIGMCGVNGFF